MPVVVPADADKVVVDYLYDLMPKLADTKGWKVGTRISAGQNPTNFVQVKTIGGGDEQIVASRPRVDIRVWADGTINTEGQRKRVARMLLACLQKRFRCKVFAAPIDVPDPANDSREITLFTVELILRGTQL